MKGPMMFTLTVQKLDSGMDYVGKPSVTSGSNRVMLRDYLVAASARAGMETHNVVENNRDSGIIWNGSLPFAQFKIEESK